MDRYELGEARVYVTTNKRCGQGNRMGEWMDLENYQGKKELLNSFRELYKDETNPVICFLDWQDVPDNFISEKDISENLFRLLSEFRELNPTDKIGFNIWLGRHQKTIPDTDAKTIIQAFKLCYQGYFGFKQQFTEYYAKEELGITKEGSPRFDFITFNRYLFEDLFIIDSGFVFRKVKYEMKEKEDKGIIPQY